MQAITEKQILEWKEELAKQIKSRDQAKKVFDEATLNINVLQGGIQFGQLALSKNEIANQPSDTKDSNRQLKTSPSK